MQHDPVSGLDFPFTQPPAPGELVAIADGLRWMRLPLPYRLDHVNIYLIRADRGWVALDTGLGTDDCRRGWDTAFAGPLKQDGLSSLIVSHFHPDHVGLANWLVERCGIELTRRRGSKWRATPLADR